MRQESFSKDKCAKRWVTASARFINAPSNSPPPVCRFSSDFLNSLLSCSNAPSRKAALAEHQQPGIRSLYIAAHPRRPKAPISVPRKAPALPMARIARSILAKLGWHDVFSTRVKLSVIQRRRTADASTVPVQAR